MARSVSTRKRSSARQAASPVADSSATCLIAGCTEAVRSRGLCKTHYFQAEYQVRSGQTTWAKLVAAGKALGAWAKSKNPFRE